jgi:hypothetical protein
MRGNGGVLKNGDRAGSLQTTRRCLSSTSRAGFRAAEPRIGIVVTSNAVRQAKLSHWSQLIPHDPHRHHPTAFAVAATLPLGSVGYEPALSAKVELILIEAAADDRLAALRGPGESYSDVILRLVKVEARGN